MKAPEKKIPPSVKKVEVKKEKAKVAINSEQVKFMDYQKIKSSPKNKVISSHKRQEEKLKA